MIHVTILTVPCSFSNGFGTPSVNASTNALTSCSLASVLSKINMKSCSLSYEIMQLVRQCYHNVINLIQYWLTYLISVILGSPSVDLPNLSIVISFTWTQMVLVKGCTENKTVKAFIISRFKTGCDSSKFLWQNGTFMAWLWC